MRFPLIMIAALVAILAPALDAVAGAVVATRAIPAGSVIAEGDVVTSDRTQPGAIDRPEDAIGLEAQLTIYPGAPVFASNLRQPALIERNDLVSISFDRGALAIRTDGRALDRGALGETVRVMNLSSRSIIVGVVAAPGAVTVTP